MPSTEQEGGKIVHRDRASAGHALRGVVDVPFTAAVVAALTRGGAEVAEALVAGQAPIRRLEGFDDVAALATERAAVAVLVDDGRVPAEELAAVAWALHGLVARAIAVVAPVASRTLEGDLPPGATVYAERRYAAVRPRDLRVFADDPPAAEPPEPAPAPRRRPRPERAGRPWDAAEEARLEALVREGLPLPEIARALGRTRTGVSERIARLAVRRGGVAPADDPPRAPPSG